MIKTVVASRILLGLAFIVFGLNGFFYFLPPPPIAPHGQAFLQALVASGYFMPFLAGLKTICGFLLLFNVWAALAMLVLAPILVNIFLFHLFLDPRGILLPLGLLLLLLFLGYAYRRAFREVLAMKPRY